MIFSMFDKSLSRKKLCHFGDDNEPGIAVRNGQARQTAFVRQKDGWMLDEPSKDNGELQALEWWYQNLRDMHNVSPVAVFNPELIDASDEIAYLVALTHFRRCVVLCIEPTNHNLHKLREFICDGPDGVDDLMDMKPFVKQTQVVAEYEAYVDGHKMSGEVSE